MNKEFEVNGVQYMAVEVPGGAKDFRIEDLAGPVLMFGMTDTIDSYRDIPDGAWKIVGLSKDINPWEKHHIMDKRSHFASWTAWDELNLNDNTLIIKKI